MNIAVIGTGGVGGYFGGKLTQILSQENNLNVFFVDRGIHLEAIQNNALFLDTDEGSFVCKPTLATDNISILPTVDLFIICVKSYDLKAVLTDLKDKVMDSTMILPLLNGVDVYERIREVISQGAVFPSCVYLGTHIEKPGKVVQKGGTCTIHFGKDPENDFFNPEIFEIFNKANVKYEWTDNPYTEIWSKFIFIASFGLVTACYDKTLGEVLQSEKLSQYVKNIISEIYQIAQKKKIPMPDDIQTVSYEKAKKFPFETKTSFQRDYEIKNKPDERDLFGGTILRLGKEYGIETGTTQMIYDSLVKK